MDKDLIIQITSENLKMIRIENQYTQEKMAEILGVPKKLLVHIEKGKTLSDWTTAIAICALFRDSPTLHKQMGADPMEMIELSIYDVDIKPMNKTMGGVIWWKNLKKHQGFKLQQHTLTKHYRILDDENYRVISTFDQKVIKEKWLGIVRKYN